ncbi:MAG TPA: CHAT domain-containing protein [Thermoanaerobaculia bacterium]|nr:CHAT domain-containing protein [Thermoanaerobaculia bacterium]
MRISGWAAASLGLATVVASGALWTASRRGREVPLDPRAFAAALAEARGGSPFAGRLVGQPELPPISAGVPPSDPERWLELRRHADAGDGAPPTAEALRRRAAALLFDGQPLSALEALSRAAELRPDDPEVLSDLVVAAVAAANPERPWLLVRALGALERATALGVASPELTWNRALVLGELHLSGQAGPASPPSRSLREELARWAPQAGVAGEDLAQGWRLFEQGHRLYDQRELARAAPVLAAARQKLAAASSPLALWAEYFHLVSWPRQASSGRSPADALAADLDRLAARLDPGRDELLLAYVDWYRGHLHSEAGRYDQAVAAFSRAATALSRRGFVEPAGFLAVLEAEIHRLLGDPRAAWFPLRTALGSSSSWRSPRQLRGLLDECALSARQLGEPEAALALQDRALAAARDGAGPETVAEALMARSATLAELGRIEAARRDLAEAAGLLARIEDPGIRRQTWANLLAARAGTSPETDPELSLAELSLATEELRGRGILALLPALELARGRLLEARGDSSGAVAALEAAAADLEPAGLALASNFERIRLAQQSREIYDRLIRLALARGPSDEALAQVERAVVLELASRRERGPAARRFLDGARRDLAAGEALVVYRLLPERLLVWVLTAGGTAFAQRPIDRSDLERQVAALMAALAAGAPADEVRGLGRELWGRVWAPAAPLVGGAASVGLVADGVLHRLPFAVLVDPERGEYLLERHAFTKIVAAADPPGALSAERPGPGDRLLVVGDPAFDRLRFPYLRRLPLARREAEAIAREAQDRIELYDADASPAKVLEALASAGTFYFAGHVQGNPQRPELSSLVLAPAAGGGSSALYATEVEQLSLPDLALVVLAACDSAGGGQQESGPLLGFARAFLAAGARVVVASQWDVGAPPTEALLVPFYRSLRQGDAPGRALQAAQLALLERGRSSSPSPAPWAAFEVFAAPSRSD